MCIMECKALIFVDEQEIRDRTKFAIKFRYLAKQQYDVR